MQTEGIQGDLVMVETGQAMVPMTDAEMMGVDLDLMKARVQKVHEVMKDVMIKDQHYGVIPGTGKKPTLLQPGAQMLCTMFRLTPKPQVTMRQLDRGHREYEVITHMHGPNGNYLGFGVGLCSTMETRYRYRNEKGVMKIVGEMPKAYWGLRDKQPEKAQALIGPGNKPKKLDDGTWAIVKYEGGGGRVENPDIADLYNTVLKIASKRSLVSGTLNITGASDVFTQDIEDMEATIRAAGSGVDTSADKTADPEPEKAERWSAEQADVVKQITEATPEWIKDTSVAAKKLTAELAGVEKSDDLEPIQAVFDRWVKGIFPDLEKIRGFADHPQFDAKGKDKDTLQKKMKAADYDAEQLHAVVEIWEETLEARSKKALEEEGDGGEAVDLNNPEA